MYADDEEFEEDEFGEPEPELELESPAAPPPPFDEATFAARLEQAAQAAVPDAPQFIAFDELAAPEPVDMPAPSPPSPSRPVRSWPPRSSSRCRSRSIPRRRRPLPHPGRRRRR